MRSSPTELAGTVAGVFSTAMQLGGAFGLALTTSVIEGIGKRTHSDPFIKYKAAMLFLAGCLALAAIAVVLFVKDPKSQDSTKTEDESQAGSRVSMAMSDHDQEAVKGISQLEVLSIEKS